MFRIHSFVLAGVLLGVGTAESRADARPNVLFIICDDLNTHVSTSGYPHIQTPAFDQLADSGMTFTRAYSQYPVCGPSRASLLHGLYPQSTGVLDNKSDIRSTRPGSVSLPQLFRDAGYWTGAVGKVFHNVKADPGAAVWDEVHRFDNDEMPLVTPVREAFEAKHGSIESGKARRLWREHYPTIATQTRNQHVGYGPSGLKDEQHKDGKNARQVVEWLEQGSSGEKPFFIALGIQKPHVPFLAPDAYFDLYPQQDLQFDLTPTNFWEHAPSMAMDRRFKTFGFELGVENDSLRREYMQAYHACISFIDAQIGRVLDALERSGQSDNTIVVLTSDHGYQLGEHFMWGKVTLFEECARVPLVIRTPEMECQSTKSSALVELVDLYPTLADLSGIDLPGKLQGRSLKANLDDPNVKGKGFAYTVVSRGKKLGKAIRTERWRFAMWPDGEELYDLQNDPMEYRNLAGSSEYLEVVSTLRSQLNRVAQRALESAR